MSQKTRSVTIIAKELKAAHAARRCAKKDETKTWTAWQAAQTHRALCERRISGLEYEMSVACGAPDFMKGED